MWYVLGYSSVFLAGSMCGLDVSCMVYDTVGTVGDDHMVSSRSSKATVNLDRASKSSEAPTEHTMIVSTASNSEA